MEEIVDIVDHNWNPTWATIAKSIAHKEWILHRVGHIHFYDMKWNIYFQQRSKTKSYFPGMLHFAVGGHISAGEGPVIAMIREGKEEIWVTIDPSSLELISTFHHDIHHQEYDVHDNEIAFDYAYCFEGKLDDWVFEDGEVEAAKIVPVDKLIGLKREEYADHNIVPYQFYPQIFEWIKYKIT